MFLGAYFSFRLQYKKEKVLESSARNKPIRPSRTPWFLTTLLKMDSVVLESQ